MSYTIHKLISQYMKFNIKHYLETVEDFSTLFLVIWTTEAVSSI